MTRSVTAGQRRWCHRRSQAGAHREAVRLLGALALVLGLAGAVTVPAAAAAGRAVASANRPVTHAVSALHPWRPAVLGQGAWLGPAHNPAAPAAAAGAGWRVQPTPNPAVWRNGFLTAVSCTGSLTCQAVGGYENRAGTGVTLAEARSGRTWRAELSAEPGGALWSRLFGVSCASAHACAAVGYYYTGTGFLPVAERWNGKRWRVQPTPSPAGSRDTGFFAVSCASARSCIAAGDYGNSAGVPLPLAERWNGKRWRVQATPSPAGATASGLFGVSCVSARSCTATGAYNNRSGTTKTLAESWNGKHWRLRPTPNPAGSPGGGFAGVSCGSARVCIATGSYGTRSGATLALAGRWNGKRWRLLPAPAPAKSAGSEFTSVSCTAARACTAAGSYLMKTRGDLTLAERWNGKHWRIEATPNPAGAAGSGFAGVSCASAGACTTAGSYGGFGPAVPLAAAWNGTRWRLQAPVVPVGAAAASLAAVTCGSPSACTAVGSFTSNAGAGRTLAENWNGARWRIQATPNPAGTRSAGLRSVSCSSSRACTAVGTYRTSRDLPLAEVWNGIRWRIESMPNPAGSTNTELFSVSCTSPDACTAVGSYYPKASQAVAFAEAWDGTRWSLQAISNPATHGQLFGVSCTSASACVAVGSYGSEIWDGHSWHFQPIATPAGTQGNGLSAVSCTAPDACTGVSSYFTRDAGPLTLAERWDGTSWRVQPTPNIAGAGRNEFNAVSCPANRACTAVGYYAANDFAPPFAFAESWDGTRWRLQHTAGPPGTASSHLDGISCASASACTAAGGYTGPTGILLTLALAR